MYGRNELIILIVGIVIVFFVACLLLYFIVNHYKHRKLLITNGVVDDELKLEYKKEHSKVTKTFSIIGNIFSVLLTIVFTVALVLGIKSKINNDMLTINNQSVLVVKSNSMSKAYSKNDYLKENNLINDEQQFEAFDMVVIKDISQYTENDLKQFDTVVYEVDGTLIIHRIISIKEPTETRPYRVFVTRGDANPSNDPFTVKFDMIKGVYTGKNIPFLGYVVLFFQSALGGLALLVLLAYAILMPIFEKKLDKLRDERLKLIGYFGNDGDEQKIEPLVVANEEFVIKDGILYRYRFSFSARLIRSGNERQEFYNKVKNEILSYKKVNNRISWKHELFWNGRNNLVELKVKGKTLCVYLPLNPKKYDEELLHFKDISEENSDFPLMLKVKSNLACKHAAELIAEVMKKYEIVKDEEYVEVNYKLKYMSLQAMLDCAPPLAKLVEDKSGRLTKPAVEETKVIVEHNPLSEIDNKFNKLIVLNENGLVTNVLDKVYFDITKNNFVTTDSTNSETEQEHYNRLLNPIIDMPEDEDYSNEILLENGKNYKYKFSFTARLIRSSMLTQDFYNEIKNEALSYKGVSSNISWKHELFKIGRNKVIMINVKGKTLCVYFPLNPSNYAISRYHHVDLTGTKKDVEFPMMMKVRSERAVKYVFELVEEVMGELNVGKNDSYIPSNYRFRLISIESMLNSNPPLAKLVNGNKIPLSSKKDDEIKYRYIYSYTARLILSGSDRQEFYNLIKNNILSYKKVNSKISWNHELFKLGSKKIALAKVKGKTLCIYLPLNPDNYDQGRFHFKDVRKEGKNVEFPMMMKVKSSRAANYVMMLIKDVMNNYNIPHNNEYKNINYKFKRMSFDSMVNSEPALIKDKFKNK